jgi:hypothetical protein
MKKSIALALVAAPLLTGCGFSVGPFPTGPTTPVAEQTAIRRATLADPQGDATGVMPTPPDVIAGEFSVDIRELAGRISFAPGSFFPNETVVRIELDTDGNDAAWEYSLELNRVQYGSAGLVVKRATSATTSVIAGTAAVSTAEGDQLEFKVPMSILDNKREGLRVRVVVLQLVSWFLPVMVPADAMPNMNLAQVEIR